MKEPHIYFDEKNEVITCSNCGGSETMIDHQFNRFKLVDHEYNKNIINPSDSNPDIKFSIKCLECERKTKLSYGPFFYY